MPTIIKPTVGRKVWYRPIGHNRTELSVFDDSQPCDATVTYVWHDRMVNLRVTGPSGVVKQYNSTMLLQDGDSVPTNIEHGGYAMWMPYQTAQQAKAEAQPDSRHPALAAASVMDAGTVSPPGA